MAAAVPGLRRSATGVGPAISINSRRRGARVVQQRGPRLGVGTALASRCQRHVAQHHAQAVNARALVTDHASIRPSAARMSAASALTSLASLGTQTRLTTVRC